MFKLNPLRPVFGLDLGTQNAVIADPNGRILVNEPTLVAIKKKDGSVFYGNKAQEMVGHVSTDFWEFIHLLKDGTIQSGRESQGVRMGDSGRDQHIEGFLDYVLTKAKEEAKEIYRFTPKFTHYTPDVVVAISCRLREKDFMSVKHAFEGKVHNASYIYQPLAMLVGTGINPLKKQDGKSNPWLICDMGHGTTDYSCVSEEDNVFSKAIPVAGSEMDEAIAAYLRREYKIQVDSLMASMIKHSIGCAMDMEDSLYLPIKALAGEGEEASFREICITDAEIKDVLDPILEEIMLGQRQFLLELSKRNPAITTTKSEVCKNNAWRTLENKSPANLNILLGGGVSLLRGIDLRFQKNLNIDITLVNNPLTAAAVGAAQCAVASELLSHYQITMRDVSERKDICLSEKSSTQTALTARDLESMDQLRLKRITV